MAKPESKRLLKTDSQTSPRCKGCGRKIRGKPHVLDDGVYGPECVRRALERLNAGEPTVVQERFI